MATRNSEDTMAPNDVDLEASIDNKPSSTEWLPMGGGRPHPQHCPKIEEYVVQFDGADDPWSPHNWSSWKKYLVSQSLLHHKQTQFLTNLLSPGSTPLSSSAMAHSSPPSTAPSSPPALIKPAPRSMSAPKWASSGPASSSWDSPSGP